MTIRDTAEPLEARMSVTCTVFGHMAGANHGQTHGRDLTICNCCGCDLIRSPGAEWTRAPKGFQVVWREFGRDDDAGSVFARMARIAPTPRRRAPRPTRERRARTSGMQDLLRSLGELHQLLESAEHHEDFQRTGPGGQYWL